MTGGKKGGVGGVCARMSTQSILGKEGEGMRRRRGPKGGSVPVPGQKKTREGGGGYPNTKDTVGVQH